MVFSTLYPLSDMFSKVSSAQPVLHELKPAYIVSCRIRIVDREIVLLEKLMSNGDSRGFFQLCIQKLL